MPDVSLGFGLRKLVTPAAQDVKGKSECGKHTVFLLSKKWAGNRPPVEIHFGAGKAFG